MIASFETATLSRNDSLPVLTNLSWTWNAGETWAVIGPSGSGKTSFAEALAGRLRLDSGTMTKPEGTVVIVSFADSSRLLNLTSHYYSQRFEFADADEPLSLSQYLQADLKVDDAAIVEVARQLNIEPLLPLSFIKLSTGQMRRARVARGLLQKPDVLILDDPFLGIDVEGRTQLAALLGTLIASGQKLLLICRPDDVPAWVTDVYCFAERGVSTPRERLPRGVDTPRSDDAKPIIELHNVTVRHGGRTILDNISWAIREGERWALVGPNGVGKTTLLSLIVGDHPQAFSNDVRLFGSRRGSGETLWDVKRRVGFVSPEFHLYFAEDLTAVEAAETGFTDTLLHKPVTAEQSAFVSELFTTFGVESWMNQRMRRLSTGQQRLALLVRALVKRPPLLVLDEPYQGLDSATIVRLNAWFDSQLSSQQTLIVTTHRREELPACVSLIKQL